MIKPTFIHIQIKTRNMITDLLSLFIRVEVDTEGKGQKE